MAHSRIIGGKLKATGTGAVGVYCVGDTDIAHVHSITATTPIHINTGALANVIGCEFDPTAVTGLGTLVSLPGDRAVRDALNYKARHANDIDAAAGIHHTLTYLSSMFISNELTNGSIFVGGSDNLAHARSMSGDASIVNTGVVTLATVNADVGTYGDASHLAQITVDAKGRITAIGEIAFSGGTDADAIHDNVSGEIAAITEKTAPVGNDLLLIEDSAASNAKKRLKVSNLPGSSGVSRSGSTTDGHLAIWNGTNADSIKDGGAVPGGSATIYESAFASPPGSPVDGDDWHITDSRLMAHRASSAWQYYWGTRKVHLVPSTSWVNQGSAMLTDTGDLTLYTPAANADNLRGRVYTAPSLNYTIDVIMIAGFKPATDTFGAYIGWSDGTKFVTFGIGNTNTSGGPFMEVIKWTNSTTFSAAYAGSSSAEPFIRWIAKPIYLRIQEDSSNRTCSYSFDEGRNYIQFHQVGRTDFLTATQVGFLVFNHHATLTTSQVILDWTVS